MKTLLPRPYQCPCGFITTSVACPTDWEAQPGDTMVELLLCVCGRLHVFGADLAPRPMSVEEQAAIPPEDRAAIEVHRVAIRTARLSEVRS